MLHERVLRLVLVWFHNQWEGEIERETQVLKILE